MLKFFFKKTSCLFYAESPFQLMQIYELIKLQDIKNFKILIRLNHYVRNNYQLIKLVKELNLKNIEYLKIIYNNKINFFFLVPKVIISIINSQKVYMVEHSGIFKLLSFFIKKENLILIEDGVGTLHSRLKPSLYKRFSIFKNNSSNYKLNKFLNIRNFILRNQPKKSANIIVGSSYIERNIVEQEIFFKMLNTIKSKNTNSKKLIYVPHRSEDEKKLKIIKNKLGIAVIKTKLPIEFINYELGIMPNVVHSTTSTCLFSMKLIYKKAKFNSYKFNTKHLIARKKIILRLAKVIGNTSFIKTISVK